MIFNLEYLSSFLFFLRSNYIRIYWIKIFKTSLKSGMNYFLKIEFTTHTFKRFTMNLTIYVAGLSLPTKQALVSHLHPHLPSNVILIFVTYLITSLWLGVNQKKPAFLQALHCHLLETCHNSFTNDNEWECEWGPLESCTAQLAPPEVVVLYLSLPYVTKGKVILSPSGDRPELIWMVYYSWWSYSLPVIVLIIDI